jgi:hypothetical protein
MLTSSENFVKDANFDGLSPKYEKKVTRIVAPYYL